jgi:hypothetical protein
MANNWFTRAFTRRHPPPISTPAPIVESKKEQLGDTYVPNWQYRTLQNYVGKNSQVAMSLANVYSQAVTTRQEYIRSSNEMRRYYLVHGILNVIADDILSPTDDGDIVSITSSDASLQKEIDSLYNDFDFNSILYDIILDLLDLGEYTLRIKVKEGKGIVDIIDDVDPLTILALYELGYPKEYFVFSEGRYLIYPASSYLHFCNGLHKERIKVADYLGGKPAIEDEDAFNKIPDYARIGTPLLYGVLSKIRELQILEQLIPAQKLNEITQSQLVSLNVPPSRPPDKVFDTVRRYEEMLNVAQCIDLEAGQISLAEILSVAGKIRVIPNFNQEKGMLEKVEVRNPQPVDDLVGSINDVRKMILSSIGIPPFILFGESGMEGGTSKSDSLRAYSRYTRRIKTYQKELKRGISQFLLIHFLNKGYHKITFDDFNIKFGESLINVADLEKLEFLDAKQEILSKNLDFVNTLQQNELIAPYINKEKLVGWISDKINFIIDSNPFIERHIVNKPEDITKQQDSQDQNKSFNDASSGGDLDLGSLGGENSLEEPTATETPPKSQPSKGSSQQKNSANNSKPTK